MIDWLSRFGAALNVWINGVRQSNAKALITLALYVGTFLVWAICSLAKINLDETSFAMWLGFLAALGGFSLATFNKERTTDYGYVERQNAGKPTTVVQTPEATITGSPVKVESPKPSDSSSS